MANYPARSSGDQTINYLRAPITFALGYTGVAQVGTLPAGCVVLRTYVVVKTAFNAGSTNTLKIGTIASDASFGSFVMFSPGMTAISAEMLPVSVSLNFLISFSP